jgi:hypothetical protein
MNTQDLKLKVAELKDTIVYLRKELELSKNKNKVVQNWSVEKKDEIERRFINIITRIGMDIPNNFEEIVQDIYEDVCQTADVDNWNDDDVVIGFRRWIESK